VQRQHLQAYEYLCHVGEAQQWIEMCLDQELGFGIVEMEEGLRNGVVLAKLARTFQGEGIVRRIYEVCAGVNANLSLLEFCAGSRPSGSAFPDIRLVFGC
jgi:hypothetical protein